MTQVNKILFTLSSAAFQVTIGCVRFRSGSGHKPSAAVALQCKFLCRTASQFGFVAVSAFMTMKTFQKPEMR
jgi:hypothetical protein